MPDLTQEEYDEWNTCPGCGAQHLPSVDCDGKQLVRPPQTGGAPSELSPPQQKKRDTQPRNG